MGSGCGEMTPGSAPNTTNSTATFVASSSRDVPQATTILVTLRNKRKAQCIALSSEDRAFDPNWMGM